MDFSNRADGDWTVEDDIIGKDDPCKCWDMTPKDHCENFGLRHMQEMWKIHDLGVLGDGQSVQLVISDIMGA